MPPVQRNGSSGVSAVRFRFEHLGCRGFLHRGFGHKEAPFSIWI